MQTMFIMQGVPGSGKSTIAKQIIRGADPSRGCVICSTDDYYMEGGKYNFRPERTKNHHRLNQQRVEGYLESKYSVIVDNTNTMAWEARPYVEMAVKAGIPIVFVRCTGHFPNVHGVPDEVVARMADRMEELSVERCLNARNPWE